jgi:ArsR family transcriptional regulator
MLNDEKALTVLVALAQGTRLQIVRTLLRSYPDGLPAGRIAAAVMAMPSTMSFHLAHLEQAGLARSRRQATSVIYTAVPEALGNLITYLTEECCGGRPKLCAPLGGAVPHGQLNETVGSCCGSAESLD